MIPTTKISDALRIKVYREAMADTLRLLSRAQVRLSKTNPTEARLMADSIRVLWMKLDSIGEDARTLGLLTTTIWLPPANNPKPANHERMAAKGWTVVR